MTKLATKTNGEKDNLVGEKFITKIKLMPDNTLEMKYKLSNNQEALTVTYCGKEEVTNKCLAQFTELNALACQIVPLLAHAAPADLKTNIIRLKYNENGNIDKVSLSIQLKLNTSNSPVNISTPLVALMTEESEESDAFRVSAENEEIIHVLLALAKAYMNGDTRTKQLSLVVGNEV